MQNSFTVAITSGTLFSCEGAGLFLVRVIIWFLVLENGNKENFLWKIKVL